MDKKDIIEGLSNKGNGEIYLGVVGAVRTGKSTFIKKCIETLIIPYIIDDQERSRCMDEIPQSAAGKQIMTTEPKFVPSSGANIEIDNFKANIKLVDCVGYITPQSIGYEDDLGNPRMVKTPWFSEEIPFSEAASIGTQKVIKDHATIGIVVTTDGSFGEMPRSNFIKAEETAINELKETNKPFIVVMNSSHPESTTTINICDDIKEKYGIPVVPISVERMEEKDIISILKEALYEFPIKEIKFNIPDWISALKSNHPLKLEFLNKIKESIVNVNKLRDTENINLNITSDNIKKAYISNLDTKNSEVTINLEASNDKYEEVLKEIVGESISSKGDLIRIFQNYSEGKSEYDSIKSALKQVNQTGYGIVLPKVCDMVLDKPEIIKESGRFGVKLKAKASSVHLIKVEVDSSFEPIIGTEEQSKELINNLVGDNKTSDEIWKSEIFGRSLDTIVQEGIQAKLSMLPDTAKYKLSQALTKMVNKGCNNLIAIVL